MAAQLRRRALLGLMVLPLGCHRLVNVPCVEQGRFPLHLPRLLFQHVPFALPELTVPHQHFQSTNVLHVRAEPTPLLLELRLLLHAHFVTLGHMALVLVFQL